MPSGFSWYSCSIAGAYGCDGPSVLASIFVDRRQSGPSHSVKTACCQDFLARARVLFVLFLSTSGSLFLWMIEPASMAGASGLAQGLRWVRECWGRSSSWVALDPYAENRCSAHSVSVSRESPGDGYSTRSMRCQGMSAHACSVPNLG
jgi:hypothetical protein